MSLKGIGRKLAAGVSGAAIAGLALALCASPAQAQGRGHGGGGFHGGGFGGGGFHGGGFGHGWGGRGWGGRGWGNGGWGRGWGGWGWGGVGVYYGGYPGWYGWPAYYPAYYYPPAYYPAYYPAYAPPAPPPVAQAPSQPARVPEANRSYDVFFDFDRSAITPTAARVIAQAAESARAEGVTRINVTGHTDTTGASSYNLALSQRRAEAVRRQLIADGVPADEITATAVGKTGLMVPTGDQVREPQNRRVEIVLGNQNMSALPPATTVARGTAPAQQLAVATCRDFVRPGAGGATSQGTACEQPDGSWRAVR